MNMPSNLDFASSPPSAMASTGSTVHHNITRILFLRQKYRFSLHLTRCTFSLPRPFDSTYFPCDGWMDLVKAPSFGGSDDFAHFWIALESVGLD